MMERTKAKKSGRFEKGRSGNPSGRPSKRRMTHNTTAGYRLAMLEVGAMTVPMVDKATGKIDEISLVRANMIALGRKGASGHAPSAKAFLEKHAEAAGIHGELTELHRHLLRENARLEILVDHLESQISQRRGGVIHYEVPEDQWMRLAGAKEEKWRNRKISVEPKV
ncbi:DUF5681 domain-containing protein [Brevundimonas sp. GW460-12-10-14-LB2]|uniref:DUF5681 domain-containing protein n=1 Tax=Brevundimonas sp. GW460-12-10-14-LB2 TaxID=1827469 RepID=UPI0012E6FF63|nr:DUF5681 domain-containing protein [Brevundimonas sp. GW460-12-10-14-LB2]